MANTRCRRLAVPATEIKPPLVFVLSLLLPTPTEIDREERSTAEPAPGVTTRARSRLAAAISEDILVWQIFVRLPANDVLSCRAVCLRWRGLTSATDFLVAHHRRQPPRLLLKQRGVQSPPDPIFSNSSHVVLGLDEHGFKFLASCDGLLLLRLSDGSFSVCNPATRQCAPLPSMAATPFPINAAGLYLHGPSGEYRVIYWHYRSGWERGGEEAAFYYILTARQGHTPRCTTGVPPHVGTAMMACYSWTAPPVMVRNCLHWEPVYAMFDGILVFDTAAESFRIMRRPAGATRSCSRLYAMEGSLGFSCFCFGHGRTDMIKLWYHEREGDVLIYSRPYGYIHHYDNTGNLLQSWMGKIKLIGLSFKESLVKHDFFRRQGCAWNGQPRFFQTL